MELTTYNGYAMDSSALATLFHESFFMILVFAVFFLIALIKGKCAIINIIFSLYLSLLITLKFPYFDFFLNSDPHTNAVVSIILFGIFTFIGVLLMRRHIPGDDYETAFHDFWKKLLLSLMATVLVMSYSYQALPVTELITPGSPIQALFGPEEHFFWWLIMPILVLFFIV
jgi:hypothetical protein